MARTTAIGDGLAALGAAALATTVLATRDGGRKAGGIVLQQYAVRGVRPAAGEALADLAMDNKQRIDLSLYRFLGFNDGSKIVLRGRKYKE